MPYLELYISVSIMLGSFGSFYDSLLMGGAGWMVSSDNDGKDTMLVTMTYGQLSCCQRLINWCQCTGADELVLCLTIP
ncbi:hypothetical protein SERLA73DRAFT_175566 [Serpula lacrymans var. lacrymans S7.3]|uniref:Uncharacterized protein n=2 Tax=Serpula lacrymans var. lacrymans TaxID=341189 RepID=F8PKF9_SERL3|nr:uncharacterized protein SERLADRAFT_458084 [Serpula lacrymans var. lacrymans S7.9]EGO03873.1 hypothetical protein SERLA73DRAFT_175566 [Serpula lacrymans var. lacrymans S7.3]EGO29800.1 hypothetical protein SERLADRAFT_458084 [Serpula lacrymans var. lacrymans S7.9]